MPQSADALWLNASPSLKRFDRPLLKALAPQCDIRQWQYCQTPDRPLSLDGALTLLHDALKGRDRAYHLLGHGTAGLLGLLYARRHPERVRSLTLLSVGAQPAINWQSYYYQQLKELRCPRGMVLVQMVYHLFGYQSRERTQDLMQVLERDLWTALSPHTLYQPLQILPGGVPVPLMICGGQDDFIVTPSLLQAWQPWMKEGDYLWQCPDGGHFFHHAHSQLASKAIVQFWQSLQSGNPSHQCHCSLIDSDALKLL